MPPHLAYVATLPCEISVSPKQAINDKLQGSVATYFRCCGVVNNQINRLRFDRIMVMSPWPRFLAHIVLKMPPHLAYVATLPCETLVYA